MTDGTAAGVTPASVPAGRQASPTYLFILLGCLGVALGGVLALNLLLGQRSLGSVEMVKAASDWQQLTRGVTYPPPITVNRPFKTLRLHERMPEINGVVFGPSTAMGLTAGAFPKEVRIYNFSQTANPLHSTIAEAEYVRQHFGERVKWLFLSIDWAVGIPYQEGEPGTMDLSRQAVMKGGALPEVSLQSKLTDALSWPRVRNLWQLLRGVWRSEDKLVAFRRAFFEMSSGDYRCPDGTLARDFDTINRGICTGFRYDGSATFTDGKRVNPDRGQQLVRAAAAPSSKYSRAIVPSGGNLNPVFFERLAGLARAFQKQGGTLVLFAPPLIPGLEQTLAESKHAGTAVGRTKAALNAWGRRAGIVIIDAGASERFGCVTQEFLDEHHAFGECYSKIFARFWKAHAAGTVRPGLWPRLKRGGSQ